MIAHLKGRLAVIGIDHAVIDVNGVGYLVGASAKTLEKLGPVDSAVTIHTEMLVAEDFIRLMGFATADERDWFKLLTHVQGVGAKVALAILSALSPDELQRACAAQDAATVARAQGVNPLGQRGERGLPELVEQHHLAVVGRADVDGVGVAEDARPRGRGAGGLRSVVGGRRGRLRRLRVRRGRRLDDVLGLRSGLRGGPGRLRRLLRLVLFPLLFGCVLLGLLVIDDLLDFSTVEAGRMQLESRPFVLRSRLESALAGYVRGLR